jgi:hypothetical protein
VKSRRAEIAFSFVNTPFQALVENRPEIPENQAVQKHIFTLQHACVARNMRLSKQALLTRTYLYMAFRHAADEWSLLACAT